LIDEHEPGIVLAVGTVRQSSHHSIK